MFSFNWKSWLKSWFRRRGRPIAKRPRARLRLEELETRLAPAVYTWTGGAGAANPDWSAAANWGGTAINPAQQIDLVFGTATAYSSVNNLIGLNINSITFNNSNFSLVGNAINLASSALITVQNGLTGESLGLPMTLLGSQQFFQVDSGATLTLAAGGQITGNAASQLAMEGGGTLIIQSNNSGFSGPFTIGNNDASMVEAENSNAFGTGIAAGNTVTVGNNSQVQLLQNPNLPAGPATPINVPNRVFLNGHGPSGTNGAMENIGGANTWSGNIVMENAVELNVFGGSLTVSGVISDTGSGFTLTKLGPGQLTLTNANTYRGQTQISQGILTIENPLALGAVPSAGTFNNVNSGSLVNQGSLQISLPAPLATAPANSQYYILANPAQPVSAANPYIGFVVPDYTLNLSGTGFNGVFALDNAAGDNAWSGPIVLGPSTSGNVNVQIETVAGVQTQLDITGVISDANPALPAALDKVDSFPLVSTGNLILEPTVHTTSIDQGNTYKLFALPGGFTDLAQFTGTGTANTYLGTTNVGFLNGGTVTLEDSQGLGPTTKAVQNSVGQNSSINLVSNIGHLDSVTNTTNRLLVDAVVSLNGPGYTVNGQDSGTLHSISGINTWGPNAAWNAANPAKPYDIYVSVFGGSIGVEPDPNESSSNSYFTSDYSLTVTGGIGDDNLSLVAGTDPVALTLSKVDGGQLILPNSNRYLYIQWAIEQGWVTVEDQYSLGGLLNGAGLNVPQGAYFDTTVDSGAALMLRSFYPNTSLTLSTNLILAGDGVSHAFGLINQMGAVEHLEGVNTLSGNITLIGQTGVGVEQVDPTILSNLTLTGEISQAPANAAFNVPAEPATINVPNTSGAGGMSQYSQVVDAGSSQGSLVLNYSKFINDDLRVYYGPIGTPGSSLIYDSGNITGTGATPAINFGPGPGTQIEIVIDKGAVGANTTWSYNGTVTLSPGYFTGGLIKLGSQELILEGNGTYQGGVDIRQGIIVDENDTALGTPLNAGAPGFTFGTTVEAGASLVLSPTVAGLNGGIADGEATWGTGLTLNGSGNSTFGYAPLAVTADDNLWSGSITLNADITIAYQSALGNQAMPANPIVANFTNAAGAPTLTGTTPTVDVTQTTSGSAAAGLSDAETLTFGGVITGGTFTLTVWDGSAFFTTGNITWVADQTTLVQAIQTALNADAKLVNNFAVSLVSPTINVAPNARLNVTGIINDGTNVASPLIHSYAFTGPTAGYTDTVGSIPITPVGGSITGAGYTWTSVLGANQGLTLPAAVFPNPDNYTIQMDFDFTNVNPALFGGTGYDRIINYGVGPPPNDDNGLYTLADGGPGAFLVAYPSGTQGPNDTFRNNVPVDLIVTRDAITGNVQAYINGVPQFLPFGFDDAIAFPVGNEFVLAAPVIEFFMDNLVTFPNEVSSGTATAIKIYDRPLTAAEVAVVAGGGTLGSSTPSPADLSVSGGGEISLSGANTYRGTTYVNQGTLTVGNGQALGGTAIAGEQTLALTNAISSQANPANPTTFNLSYNGVPIAAPIPYTGLAADAANIQTALTNNLAVGSIMLTGTTNGTTAVTGLASTAQLSVGMPVSGVGIPAGTTIAAITSGTAITLSEAAGNALSEFLTFGNVTVIQENPGVFLVTFYGSLANTQTLISPSIFSGGVTGTAIAAGFEGGTEVANSAQLQLQDSIDIADEPLTIQGSGSNLEPTEQIYTVGTTTTGAFAGTYSLNFNGAPTAALPYNATAAQIQAALQNLPTVGAVGGQVSVNLLSISRGNNDTQTLFVPGTATAATNFGLTFGPTTYDATARSTGNIFTVANPYNPADYFVGENAIANALNALTNVTEVGGLVTVGGTFTTVNGVAGIQYSIAFSGGLSDQASLPALQLTNPAPSGPGALGIAMESHTQGAPPSETFEVTYQGSLSGTNQPLLTVPSVTLTTTVSTPALQLAGGSTNSTADQWFSNTQGTGTLATAVTNTQSYYGATNGENAAGPVTSVAVNPKDPNVIYIATAGGGAWRTQDGGQTWQPLFDSDFAGANPAVMFGGAIAIDPSHQNIIYYATGNDNISGFGFGIADSYYGTGVYESTNYGETWTLLTDTSNPAYTVNSSSPGNPLYGTAISKIIVVDPTGNTPGTIAVAASDVNTNNGIDINGTAGNAGVWLYNQGKWTNTTAGVTPLGAAAFPSTNGDYVDLFYDGNTMYTAVFEGGSSAGETGIYSVPNFLTGGPVWNWQISDAYPVGAGQEVKLAGDAVAGAPLFASEANVGSLGQIQWVDPVFGVNVWTTVATAGFNIPNYLNPVAGYANTIYYDQFNGDVYVGGTDQVTAGVPGTNFLLQSNDDGVTWTDIVNGAAAGPETGIHSITADQNGNLIVGSDGGVWEYNITTLTWTDITGNLADSQYLSVATDPNNANIILAGGHSVGLDRYSLGALGQATVAAGAVTGVNVLNGDSGYSSISPPMVSFVGGGGSGATAVATVNAAGVITAITVTAGGSGYASVPEVVITPSGVQTWTQVAGGDNDTVLGGGDDSDGGEVAFVPTLPGAVYFQEAGDLGYSTDDGVTWTATNVYGASPPQYAPFAVNPNNPNSLIAATGNFLPAPGTPNVVRWPLAGLAGGMFSVNPVAGWPATFGAITAMGVADFQGAYQADPSFTGLTVFAANHPDPSTIYVTDGKSVAVTKSLGAHWVFNRGPTAAQLGNTTISDLIVDPADRDTVFLVTSGYSGTAGVGHVFETSNAGQSWTDISAGLPDQSVWTIAIDPYTNNLYLGTDSGVYELAGGVGTWQKFGVGLPNVMVTDININNNANVLTISTYGRGTWQYYLDDTTANAGALRALGGNNVWGGSITLVGPTTVGVNGSQNLQDGFSGATLTILGTITDSTPNALGNTVSKIGGGDLVLGGANTYAGVTLDNQGNVVVDNPAALGNANVAGSQLLYFNNMVPDVSQYTLSFGAGAGSTSSALTYQGIGGTGPGSDAAIIQSALQGLTTIGMNNVLVTPEGSGAFLLTFPNAPLNNTQLLATASIVNSAVNGLLGSSFTEVAGGTVVANGAALELESSLSLEPITLNGNGIQPPSNGHYTGAIDNVSNANTYTGTITLNSNSTIGILAGQLTIASANAFGIVDGGTPASAYSLDKEGNGTLVLASPDSYQGGTTISVGAVEIANSAALGASTGSTIVSDGAQLQLTAAGPPTLTAANLSAGAGLALGTTYYYVVTAINATGDESVISNQLSAKPITAGMQQVSLAWNAVAGAVQYRVYRSTTSGNFTNALLAVVSAPTVILTDTGLATGPGTPGGLKVLGQHLYLTGSGLTNNGALANVAGNNTWAGPATLSAVPDYSVTSSPEGVVAIEVDPTNTLTLAGNINEGPPIVSPTQSAPAGQTGGALSAGPFYYVITALTPYGESLASNQLSYTPAGGKNEVTLTWNQVPGATGYNVYRSLTSGNFANAALYSINSGAITTFLDTGLVTGTGTPNAAASSGLAEIGAGTLVLAGNNSFTGGTYIGYVFGNVNDSGVVAPSLVGSGGVNGGVIDIQSSTALGNDQNNEIQRITTFEPPNTNPAQTFNLSFNGVPTGNLPFGASAAAVQAALNGLSTINASGGSVTVTQSNVQTGLDEVQTLSLSNPTSPLNAPTLSTTGAASGGSLTALTTYFYEVTAVIPALGESVASSPVVITTSTLAADLLSAPLTWTAIPGATSYKIYRSTNAGDFNQAYLTTVTGTAYTDSGPSAALTAPTLVPFTSTSIAVGGSIPLGTYDYVITSTGPAGESVISTALVATISSPGSQEVHLSWGVVPGATGYRIYRSAGGNFTNSLIAIIASGATTAFTDLGTVPATFSPPVQTQYTLSFSIALNGNTNANVNITGLASTAQLAPGMLVTGNGIPAGDTIASITNGTSIKLLVAASAPPTIGVPLTFTAVTAPLNYLGVGGTGAGSDAAAIQAALQGLKPIGVSNVIVTPDATDTVFTITFGGALSDTPQNTIGAAVGVTMTGTFAATSNLVTGLPSTNQLVPGMLVSGTGIPTGTTIVAINGAAITLSAAATAAGGALTFAEPTVTAAGAEVISGDGGLSDIYNVQFNGVPLNGAAQPLLVATSNSNELIVGASEAATGGIGALVYNGAALQVDGDPNETGASITIPSGETLALNGNGPTGGALLNVTGNNVWQGTVILQSSSTVAAAATTQLTITGLVQDAPLTAASPVPTGAPASLTKVGSGTVSLAPATQVINLTNAVSALNAPTLNVPTVTGAVGSGALTTADFYEVTAIGPNGETVPSAAQKPGVVPNNQLVNLTWTNPLGAATTGYRVYRSLTGAAGSFTLLANIDSSATLTLTDNGILPAPPITGSPPTQTQFTLSLGSGVPFTTAQIAYTGSTALSATIQAQLQSILNANYNVPSAPIVTVTPVTATTFNVTLSGVNVANVPPLTGAIVAGASGNVVINTNTFSGAVADNAGILNIQSAQALGVNTSAVEEVSVSGSSGTFSLLFNSPATNGTTTNVGPNQNVVTGISAAAIPLLAVGMEVFGFGIPLGTTITGINAGAKTITLSANAASAGTAPLTFGTGALQYGVSASGGASPTASVQNALNALPAISSINPNGVSVTQTGNNYFVYFNGPGLAHLQQNALSDMVLTAGISSITITQPLAGGASNVVVASGAALQMQSTTAAQAFSEASGKFLTLTGAGFNGNGALENVSGTNTWGATPITLGGAGTSSIGADTGSTLNINQPIAGSGAGLNKVGAGTVVFNADNTYTGLTDVHAGQLDLQAPAAGVAIPGNLQVGDNTPTSQVQTLNLAAFGQGDAMTVSYGVATSTAFTYYKNPTFEANLIQTALNGLSTIGGLLPTAGSVSVTPGASAGVFLVTFGGVLTGTAVSPVLQISATDNSPAPSSIVVPASITTIAAAAVPNSVVAQLELSNQINPGTVVTVNADGLFDYNGNNISQTVNTLTINGGTASTGAGTNGALTATTINVNAGGTLTTPGAAGSFTTAALNVTDGSVLLSGLNSNATVTGALTMMGGVINLSGAGSFIDLKGSLTAQSDAITGAATITGQGTLELDSAAPFFTVNPGGASSDLIVAAPISAGAADTTGALAKTGAGRLELAAANTYQNTPQGITTIINGDVQVDSVFQLQFSTVPAWTNNADTFQLTYNNGTQSGTVPFNILYTGTTGPTGTDHNILVALQTLLTNLLLPSADVIVNPLSNNVFNVAFTGLAAVGVMQLSATNIISASHGALAINAVNDIGSVNLNASGANVASLSGTGVVGATNITGTGTIDPGNNSPAAAPNIGTLQSTAAATTWTANTTFFVDLGAANGNGDALNVAGSLNLGGAKLTGTTLSNIPQGNSYTIINAAGGITGTLTGTFGSPNTVFISGEKFNVAYLPTVNPTSVVLTRALDTLAGGSFTITSSATAPVYGQDVVFSVTVQPELGAILTANTTVTFMLVPTVGSTISATFTVPTGATNAAPATISWDPQLNVPAIAGNSALAWLAGNYTMDATFTDPAHSFVSPVAATPLVFTVHPGNVTITPSAIPAVVPGISPVYGQDVKVTAVISPNSVAGTLVPLAMLPGGTVTFDLDSTTAPTASMTVAVTAPLFSPSWTIPSALLTAGAHQVFIIYNGDANYAASSTPYVDFSLPIQKNSTAVSFTPAPAPASATLGAAETFTVVVNPGGMLGTPTGDLNFYDAAPTGTPLNFLPIPYTGSPVTFSTAVLSKGAHIIYAVFTDTDGNYTGSTGSVSLTVNTATTQTTIESAVPDSPPTSPTYGQAVNFSIQVSPSSPTFSAAFPNLAPSGTVQLWLTAIGGGGTLLGTVAISSSGTTPGFGTITTNATALPVGLDAIFAQYTGDLNFGPSPSSAFDITVYPATTQVLLTANPSTGVPVAGQPVKFTATVTSSAGTPSAGTVTFTDNVVGMPPVQLDALPVSPSSPGVYQFTTASGQLTAGVHSITAAYTDTADSNFAPGSFVLAPFQVVGANSKVVVTAVGGTTATSANYGVPIALQATVTPVAPGSVAPALYTGTVTFSDSVDGFLGSVPANGTDVYTLPNVLLSTSNAHAITATFSSDANLANNTGILSPFTVVPATTIATTPTILPAASPIFYGESVTFSTTVTASGGGAPIGGTVTFYDGATAIGVMVPFAGGVASYTTTVTQLFVGTNNITAIYNGSSPNYAASLPSGVLAQAVSAAGTTIVPGAFTATPTVSAVNQPVTLSATVTVVSPSSASVPVNAGSVTFVDTTTGQTLGGGAVPVNSSGTATLSVPFATTGSHNITMIYSHGASVNFASMPAPVALTLPLTVRKASTVVVSPISGAAFGTTLNYSVSVTGTAGPPTGTINVFIDGSATPYGASPYTLVNGAVTIPISALSAGTLPHTIQFSYSGDPGFAPASATINQVVNPAATTTALGATAAVFFGQPVTFSATVTSSAGTPTSGVVNFYDGSTLIGTGNLGPSNTATFQTTATQLAVGNHTITAKFAGAGNFAAGVAASTAQTQTVKLATTQTLVSPLTAATYGASVTFTATVNVTSAGSPGPVNGGTVKFLNNGVTLATITLTALTGNVASYTTTTPLTVASHTITAVYSGNIDFATSTSTAQTQTISKATTQVTSVTPSVASGTYGQAVTFTANVSVLSGAPGTLTGTVAFLQGGAVGTGVGGVNLGSATLKNGVAVLTTTATGLAVTTAGLPIYAVYTSTNANAGNSTGMLSNFVVNAATPTVTITPSSVYWAAGQTVNFTVAVATAGAVPAGSVTFTVTGPSGTTLTQTLAAGQTTFSYKFPTVGNYTVSATYNSTSGNFHGNSATPILQSVLLASALGAITASPASPAVNQTTKISVTLTGVGIASNLGTVVFLDNGVPITAPVTAVPSSTNPTGAITYSISVPFSAAGTYPITAYFTGDSTFNPTIPSKLLLTVTSGRLN